MVLAFGEHRLDIERRELRHRGELLELEPKVFDLLAFLRTGIEWSARTN